MKAKKNPPPRKAQYLFVPIYGQEVYLCLDKKTFVACEEWVTGRPGETPPGRGRAMKLEHPAHGVLFLCGVFDGGMATLAHELGHICFWMLHDMGVPVNADDNEAFCYLQGYLMDKLAAKVPR